MRIARHILTLLVLLTSGLMAVAEVPELLTLSNDVSNDFECAVLGEQRTIKSHSRQSSEPTARRREPAGAGNRRGPISSGFSSPSALKLSLSLSLPMLCVQRK